ncbi:MAG: hypothetical protein ACPGC1_01395 [Pseudomonadales bacterium]
MSETLPRSAAMRRNFLAQILHGTFGQAGQRLITAPTFMPAFLLGVLGSELLVGLCRSLQALSAALSPTLAAHLLGQRQQIKSLAIGMAFLARVPLLLLALLAAFGSGPLLGLWIGGVLVLFGLCQGAQQVALNLLRARTIRPGRRGAALGARNFFGGLAAMGLALWLGSQGDNNSYSLFFSLAFGLTALGVASLLLTREAPLAPQASALQNHRLKDTLGEVWRLTQSPSPFRTFLGSYSFTCTARMALPFYILFLTTSGNAAAAPDAELIGLLSAIWIGAAVLSRLPLGLLADAIGGVRVYRLGIGAWFVGNGVFLAMSLGMPKSLTAVVIGLAILGVGSAATELTAQNLVLELGANDAAPQRLSATTTVAQFLVALSQVLGGALLQYAGFLALAGTAGLLLFLALLRAGHLSTPSRGP